MPSAPAPTGPLWTDTAPLSIAPPLDRDLRTGVCVIGAGVAGITTAYLLLQAGKTVTVVDASAVGSGETCHTTAHLTVAVDVGYRSIAALHGEDNAHIVAESQRAAIRHIEAIVENEEIACDFRRVDGYLCSMDADNADTRCLLEDEQRAARAAGLTDATLVPRVPIPNVSLGAALHYPQQAQFHPLKYLAALVAAIRREGGAIYGDTRVVRIEGDAPTTIVTRRKHQIVADHVVVATNAPITGGLALETKLTAYRSYVVAFRIPRSSVPQVLLWDTETPYHYVRVQTNDDPQGDDVLIVGGEDHKVGQPHDAEERYTRVEQWTRTRFPMAGEVVTRWSGQVRQSADGLAYLGKSPGGGAHTYVITGDCCNGITNATIGGIIVTDSIVGYDDPWITCYDPSRVRPGSPLV